MSPRHRARLAALLAAAALALPTAAHAEKVVTEDAVGDVQAFDVAGADAAYVATPDNVSTDITRTVAAYGTSRLSVRVHYRDLLNTWFLNTSVRVRTPKGPFDVVAVRKPGEHLKSAILRGRGDRVACRGLRAKYDGAADVVTMSVPAACFGAPRWVQLMVGGLGADSAIAEDQESFLLYVDDAHRDILRDNSIGKGPRIHRG